MTTYTVAVLYTPSDEATQKGRHHSHKTDFWTVEADSIRAAEIKGIDNSVFKYEDTYGKYFAHVHEHTQDNTTQGVTP